MQPSRRTQYQTQQIRTGSVNRTEECVHRSRAEGGFFRVRGAQGTSTTPSTFASSVDYFEEISKAIDIYKNKYHGGKHAGWARNLFKELGSHNKISIPQIQKYACKLVEHINTIKHWKIDNVLQVFTYLSRIGFFNQINKMSRNANHIIAFRNELINQLNEKFDEFPLSPLSENLYVTLLWGICDQINIEEKATPTVHNLLLKIQTAFMNASFSLAAYNYKEISNIVLTICNRVKSYKSIFFPVLEKHFSCMVEWAEKKENKEINSFLSMYLTNTSKLLKLEFTADELFKSNIIKLINNIDYTENTKIAVLGLQAITTMLEKKVVLLKEVEPVIKRCLSYIKDNSLKFEETSITLRSISRYAITLKENSESPTPIELTTVIDYYLNSLIEHKEKLPIVVLYSTIIMFIDLLTIEYPIAEPLEEIIQIYNKRQDEFLKLPKNDLHSVMINIAELSVKLKNRYHANYALKLISFFNTLIPRYLKEIRYSPLNEKLNAIQALSQLIESGFLADAKMKRTFNHLVLTIDEKIIELTEHQLIEYFRNITTCFSLLSPNPGKILKYAEQIMNLSTHSVKNPSMSLNRKLTLLKTLLTFNETNFHILNSIYLEKFKLAIKSMYDQICLEKTDDQYFKTIVFAANWLGYDVKPHPDSIGNIAISDIQAKCLNLLKEKFEELHFEEEQSVNGLPPCDIMIPNEKIIIEVQGMFHFLDKSRKFKNGTSILKNALYKKKGYHVIEVQVIDGKISEDEMNECVEKIKDILQKPQSMLKVNF